MALLSEKAEDAPRGRRAAPRFGATAARILRRARRPRAVDVRLADKLSYVLGVCGCSLTQGVFVQAPEHMWLLYALAIGPLLAVRTAMYRAARQAIFMLDFCYAVQALLLLHIFKLPCSRGLHFALFALSSGPLALAIVAWRNSLVFHSIDKVNTHPRLPARAARRSHARRVRARALRGPPPAPSPRTADSAHPTDRRRR